MEGMGTTVVRPWGNSQGIRIPKKVLQAMETWVGDELTMRVEGERLILEKTVARQTLREYAAPYGGTLGPYREFDFGEGPGIGRWLDDTD